MLYTANQPFRPRWDKLLRNAFWLALLLLLEIIVIDGLTQM